MKRTSGFERQEREFRRIIRRLIGPNSADYIIDAELNLIYVSALTRLTAIRKRSKKVSTVFAALVDSVVSDCLPLLVMTRLNTKPVRLRVQCMAAVLARVQSIEEIINPKNLG